MPADPNVISALEGFVRHYAARQIELHEKHFSEQKPTKERPHFGEQKSTRERHNGANGRNAALLMAEKEADLQLVKIAIKVCMEVAEGLRIWLDSYADYLLYEPEVSLFKKAIRGREAASLLSKVCENV